MKVVFSKARNVVRGNFSGAAGILAGGTVFAQIITLITLPILTRIYSPEAFGVLAVFAAIVTILSVSACLRFEIAIPMPEKDEEAINLLVLSLIIAALVSIVVTILINFFLSEWVIENSGLIALKRYMWIVPIGIFLMAASNALQFWVARKKAFLLATKVRVVQSGLASSSQLLFGWFNGSALGLLIGQVLSSGGVVFGLSLRMWKDESALIRQVTVNKLIDTFRNFQNFPKYSAGEALANSASIQLPIIIISTLVAGADVGMLMLAMRIMQVPMSLLGAAVSQVFLAHAPAEYRAGRLGIFTATTLGGLLKVGVGPILFGGLVAPHAFKIIFGAEWGRAGDLALLMAPWMALQFLTSPLSMTLHITNNQRAALAMQLLGLVLRVGFVAVAIVFNEVKLVEYYIYSGCIFYFLYLFLVLRKSGCKFVLLYSEVGRGMPFVAAWLVLGLIAAAGFEAFNG